MKRCKRCWRWFLKSEVQEMLEAMFGADVDEDYLVIIHGLCPRCWPEYE